MINGPERNARNIERHATTGFLLNYSRFPAPAQLSSLTAPSGEHIPMVKDNGGSYLLIQKLL
jgi:hypothetical protein